MTTDYRAMCAELLNEAIYLGSVPDDWPPSPELVARARALLAQPEPEEPSDEELTLTYAYAVAAAVDNKRGPFTTEAAEAAQLAGLRAVLARWGILTPQPPADGELAVNLRMDLSSECLKRLCDGLAAAVKPNGGYRELTTDDDISGEFIGEQQVSVTWWLPEHGCDSLENTLDAIKGRLLATVRDWLPTAVISTPQPPADGEVAELVGRLKELAHATTKENWREFDMRLPAEPLRDADLVLTRAADLLERQLPANALPTPTPEYPNV